MDTPLSGWWCAVGWLGATAIFVVLLRFLHGPAEADSTMSVYATWAIAHGQWACAYPPNKGAGYSFIAPLYPLLSGGLVALFHVGGSVPFPSHAALGGHCAKAVTTMSRWSIFSKAWTSTLRIGYLSWLFVMAGVVALLRAAGRGRCGWEPVALVVVACAPAVWMPLQLFFHPQDLLAMGLILGSLACVLRGRWVWAGVLLGLGLTSQQFPWLALAPLMIVAPVHRRFRFAASAAAAVGIIDLPLIVISSGRAIGPFIFGSGGTPPSVGGTVLWEFDLHGASLIAISRILPIVLSMVLARWAVRRLGPRLLEPVPLVSLIATALTLRLVFEVDLWGYYFLAVALLLIVLNVLCGRVRVYLVAWLLLVGLAFNPANWGGDIFARDLPLLLWQVILVSGALAMAIDPLIAAVGGRQGSDALTVPRDWTTVPVES